jgi:hypothetical protein
MTSDLESFFSAAREAAPLPRAELVARIEAEALAEQQRRARPVQPAAQRRSGLWSRLVAGLGGAGVMAGLASTAMAGVWLGAVQPQPVANLTTSLGEVLGLSMSYDQIELIPSLDPFQTEG